MGWRTAILSWQEGCQFSILNFQTVTSVVLWFGEELCCLGSGGGLTQRQPPNDHIVLDSIRLLNWRGLKTLEFVKQRGKPVLFNRTTLEISV